MPNETDLFTASGKLDEKMGGSDSDYLVRLKTSLDEEQLVGRECFCVAAAGRKGSRREEITRSMSCS